MRRPIGPSHKFEAALQAPFEIPQKRVALRQLVGHAEPHALSDPRRQALLRTARARALERCFVLGLLLVVADGEVEALLDIAGRLFTIRFAVLLRLGHEQLLALESADDVEAHGVAHHEVVATIVDGKAVVNQDMSGALAIAHDLQAADDAVAVERTVVQLILLDHVVLSERQIAVGQEMPAEVVGPVETHDLTALRPRRRLVVTVARRWLA